MMEINGYQVYQLEQQSTPIRKVYSGHHKTRQPQTSCRIQAIYDKDVPKCYIQYMKFPYYDFKQPEIMLKHIFTTPAHPNQVFFVEYQSTQSRQYHDLDPQRRFLCVFQIVMTVFNMRKRGLIHDLSLQNIAIGKERTYFYNFGKSGSEMMNESQIKRKVDHLIAQLMHTQENIAGDFMVGIDENSISLQWNHRIDACQIHMSYCFKHDSRNKEIIAISSERSFKGDIIDKWEQQIASSKLLDFIPSYDSKSNQWCIPSITENNKRIVKSALQVDEGGKNQKEVTITDTNQSFPYNSVGTIISLMKAENKQDYKNFGTAVLVSNNLILTCAHNFLKWKDNIKYQANAADIKFELNGKAYNIQRFELKQQYRLFINRDKRYEYDYALLKLRDEDKIEMKLYVELVYNYKETEMELKLKGFYREQQIIKSKIIASTQLKFEEKRNQLSYGYASKKESSQGGFSGGPIFIILAELDFEFKYHFMIGIHNSGNAGKNGFAAYFNQEIIKDLSIWENKMTNSIKVFSNILDFSKITKMDTECEGMRSKLNEIVFNANEIKYFPKLFAQAGIKNVRQQYIENMYKTALGNIDAQKKRQILVDLGSFNLIKRHNNAIFIHHIRNFESWHSPWQSFGESSGIFVFYVYIALQIEYFFQNAKVRKQRQQQYKQLQKFLQIQKDKVYQIREYCIIAAAKIHEKFQWIQKWLREIQMNDNFKKLLLMEIQFIRCLERLYKNKTNTKLFEVSKICVLGFLAKEIFTKIGEVNKEMKEYLYVFNEIMLVGITFLMDESLLEARQAKYSFAWSVRMLIKEHPSIREDLLRFDPTHSALMNKAEKDRQFRRKAFVLQHYFGVQVQRYLKFCMKMLYK